MIIGILAIPGSFGRGNAVIKRLSEGDNPGSILSTSIIFLAVSSVVLVFFVLLTANIINKYVGAQIAGLVAVGIVLRSLYTLPLNILKGELRVGEAATLSFLQKLLWLFLGFVLITNGYRYRGLIISFLISYFIIFLFGVKKISTPLGDVSSDTARSLFNYWKFTVITFIDSAVYNWADVAIIGLLLTQTEVGVYEVAWRLAAAVILVSATIESIIFPQISSWDASKSREKIEHLFPGAIFGALFLAIPAFFGALLLSDQLLEFLFGKEYVAANIVLIILMFSKLFESIDRIFKNFLEGIDLPNLRMRAVLVSIFFNIILNLIFVYYIGLAGAALATTIAFTSSTIITIYYLNNVLTLHFPISELIWSIISSIIMFSILYLIKYTVDINSLLRLSLIIMLGILLYSLSILIHPSIRSEIISNISKISG
jgi:O-antigen/teichoic acid export membrane protein